LSSDQDQQLISIRFQKNLGDQMRAVDIIIKKRDKQVLSKEEIEFFIHGFTMGEIPDYQVSAWAMAVLLNGMTAGETHHLTTAMMKSGETLDLSEVAPVVVDKHSTGGVGDKTTLVVQPLVKAGGLPVGKMSGRGLGFTGGTLDKIESIPGFRTELSTKEFIDQLASIGLVLSGQTTEFCSADRKLYALRDVTGTVDSIPLIASSIMSKKLAAGTSSVVLDVKVGHGAFMKTEQDARELSVLMVDIAKRAGRKAVALLSDMNQPLGMAVGNALELKEAIDTLHGGGPPDFREHCIEVTAHLYVLGGICSDLADSRLLAVRNIENGKAWDEFCLLVSAQGGDVDYVLEPDRLPKAEYIMTVSANRSGYLKQVDAREIGEIAVSLGAGRVKKGDRVDHAVGLIVLHNVGDYLDEGDQLVTIHANHQEHIDPAIERLESAIQWSDEPVDPLPLFYGVIE
jgi:pyrimidine-nucleoside phosphorylase